MPGEYVPVGPRPYLERLLKEYGLTEAGLGRRILSRQNPSSIGGEQFDLEYMVHRSVLRSHGAFRSAGDAEAEAFCNEVADAMVTARRIRRKEAVARINRQWSSEWIVGLDLVYHQTAKNWAEHIYRCT